MTNNRTTVEQDPGQLSPTCPETRSEARKWRHIRHSHRSGAKAADPAISTEDPEALVAQLRTASFWRRKALLANTIMATPSAGRSSLLKAIAEDDLVQQNAGLRDTVLFAALEHAEGNDLTRIMALLSPDQRLAALAGRPLSPNAPCATESALSAPPRKWQSCWRLLRLPVFFLGLALVGCGLTYLRAH
ncbi:hypothetical protein FJU08_04010 [Martelella alba]|uniref:Uncharacterized protein n=1 Tax=Martelella alba TaxID=2590451 RepID=A0A506UG75_9HYPH|nr:hypothetical protein [Martelella alba]TPW32185.1 hypothetical protein FJU08_04010 [Martelella alba]